MVLDALDRALLAELRNDARLSYRELARRTGTTTPTVSSRVRRMEQLGIILGYTVRLDPRRFQSSDDDGSDHAGADAVDLAAPVQVACHLCGRQTDAPVYGRVAKARHPFCCTTCRATYLEKDARLRKGF